MIQTVLGVFLILLHIVCCVLVWLGIKTHLLKVKKYLMALVIFVPFWGTVCVLLLHLQMLTRRDNRIEPGVEKLRVNEEIYKNIFQAVSDTDKKIVPLEEALLINEPRVRRAEPGSESLPLPSGSDFHFPYPHLWQSVPS